VSSRYLILSALVFPGSDWNTFRLALFPKNKLLRIEAYPQALLDFPWFTICCFSTGSAIQRTLVTKGSLAKTGVAPTNSAIANAIFEFTGLDGNWLVCSMGLYPDEQAFVFTSELVLVDGINQENFAAAAPGLFGSVQVQSTTGCTGELAAL